MKRFRKVYLEISNRCNLKCSFCPGTRRTPGALNREQFTLLLEKLRPWTDFLYFHLMGEPLCHPLLGEFLEIAHNMGFRVILTTNGTLLPQLQETLLNAPALHKVNISLHAFEANDLPMSFEDYLRGAIEYGKAAAGSRITVYRLWNEGGADLQNGRILAALEETFPKPWIAERHGTRIGDRVYLEFGEKFDWPDLSAEDLGEKCFCYGMRDQIGVLCDGTVVPCCLDHEGDIPLGNLLTQDMNEIMSTELANSILEDFTKGKAPHALCRRCGFARTRFG